MRVALVNHNLGSGGAEKLIHDMAIEMKSQKIDVDIVLLTSYNGVYENSLKEKRINVIHLSDKWDIYNPKNIFRLIKVLKSYDVIHTHTYAAQLWTAVASYFLSNKVKLITTEHSTENRRRKIKIFKYLDQIIYSRYNLVVSISESVRESLESWLPTIKKKNYLITNGINLEKFENSKPYLKSEFGFTEKDIIIVMIARFNYPKDHKTVIKALSKMDSKYKLLFVGEGPLKAQSMELAKTLMLEERIKFLGFREDVDKIIKTCDMAILSSFYEGMPLSVLEIMASGTPIIGSNVSGIKEIIKDSGVLFEVTNEDDLKKAILNVMHGDRKRILSSEGQLQSKHYSIQKMVGNYRSLYCMSE